MKPHVLLLLLAAAPPPKASEMVRLPGGTFWFPEVLERSAGQDIQVHARRKVTLAPFELDATEVTVAAYAKCVESKACSGFDDRRREDPLCNMGRPGREAHPMNCVNWHQADTYCKTQGKRLPTEEEWEYAARGGRPQQPFPWGSEAPVAQVCWSGRALREGTCPVASFPPEAFGLYDLGGNVTEWTSTAEQPLADHIALFGPPKEPYRVMRGGQWGTNVSRTILAHSTQMARFSDGATGFRCAR